MTLNASIREIRGAEKKSFVHGDYAYLAVYAMRAAGIPVAIEFVPHWENENGAHIFNIVYDNDSTFHDFLGAEKNPDEHLIQFHNTFPKVYRKTFGKLTRSESVV